MSTLSTQVSLVAKKEKNFKGTANKKLNVEIKMFVKHSSRDRIFAKRFSRTISFQEESQSQEETFRLEPKNFINLPTSRWI